MKMKAALCLLLPLFICLSLATNERKRYTHNFPLTTGQQYGMNLNPGMLDDFFGDPFFRWQFNLRPGTLWPGNIPVYTGFRPDVPDARDSEEEDEDREPIETDSDEIIEPEVGLKNLLKLNKNMKQQSELIRNTGFSDIFKIFDMELREPWWEGPNVCVDKFMPGDFDETEIDTPYTSSLTISSCVLKNNRYECIEERKNNGKTSIITTIYKCCYGFVLQNGKTCVKVDTLPLIDTIVELNGTDFLEMLKTVDSELMKNNVTVFLPTNEALRKFTDFMLETNNVEMFVDPAKRRRRGTYEEQKRDLVLNHLVNGLHEIYDDDSFKTMNDNELTVTTDGKNHAFVNCARVISKDVFATTGIIHQVDRVLVPVKKFLDHILETHPDLTMFYEYLKKNKMLSMFAKNEGWTIFAPSNEALKNAEKLFTSENCLENFLKNHILPETRLCSGNVHTVSRVKTAMNVYLHLSIAENATKNDFNGELFNVEDAKVIMPDIIAKNGIIHIIDKILMPDKALPIDKLLLKNNLTAFHSIIKRSGMMSEALSWRNVTLFVPTNSAMERFSRHFGNTRLKNMLEYADSFDGPLDKNLKEELKNFVLHHITKGSLESCGMKDNTMLHTLDESAVRNNLYSTLPAFVNTFNRATVDCARLLHFDEQQCDNMLHQIDRPLIRNNNTILDEIKERPELSTLNMLIDGTDMKEILQNEDGITFVAPTNDALADYFMKDENKGLFENKEALNFLLRGHTLKNVMCCSGLSNAPWPLSSNLLTINNDPISYHDNYIGSSEIKKCDISAKNGVLHTTDKVIPIKMKPKARNPNVDILLFGI